ncbi:rhamnulokinase family protein [Armatimonas sp.]|uniref:rhamnulokinase n=1 Tax=Armatimonas sp. TaxID=1872638 RepID=UPI003751E432
MARILALDLGAESGRGVVGTLSDNGTLSLEEVHRFPTGGIKLGAHLHWNLPGFLVELQTAIKKATEGGAISSLGIDTWGVDFGLLGPRGELVALPVHYRDPRTVGGEARLYAKVPKAEIFAKVGIQSMALNTLFQVAALAEQSPKLVEASAKLLFMPDLLHYLLTGTAQIEYTIASTSQMLDATSRKWATGTLGPLNLPMHLLGSVVPDGSHYGTCDGIPVFAPGGHDTACAVAAVPAEPGESWAYLSSGTWSLMGLEIPSPILTADAEAANVTNEGGVLGSIRLLKNIGGLWLVQECRRAYARLGSERSYDQLTRLASDATPLAALIDPDHPSLYAPDDMPKAIRELCAATGQTPPEGVGATIRCCLDSLGLKYRLTLKMLERLTGRKITTLHIVGGGSQNRLLNQIAADATGCTVIAGPVEATAIGNLLLQARAQGLIADLSEIRSIVRASFPVETYHPDPTMTARFIEAKLKE